MGEITKWQRGFISKIFLLCIGMEGRFNFLQMGREGEYHEQTYRNNFEREFDFMTFNSHLIDQISSGELIIAFDPSYITKSGKKTKDLGYFFSGTAGMYKKGLEIGGIAAIDTKQNTAYHLEAIQSPSAKKGTIKKDYTLVDHYAKILIQRAPILTQKSKILVVDGYFAKGNFINPLDAQTDFTIICRLRDDANLMYIYNGPKSKGKGRPKKYQGKVNTKNIDKRIFKKKI